MLMAPRSHGRPAFVGPEGGNSLHYHRGHRDKPGKRPKTALMFLTIKVKYDADNDQCSFSLECFSTSCQGRTQQSSQHGQSYQHLRLRLQAYRASKCLRYGHLDEKAKIQIQLPVLKPTYDHTHLPFRLWTNFLYYASRQLSWVEECQKSQDDGFLFKVNLILD